MNQEICNCHECTQVRYRMSFQYQIDSALNPISRVSDQKPDPESFVPKGEV